ncbi:hypothetical protein [Psychrobacter sp. DAB_AL32B]|uniref:hypothetical protein n=1 Tax=Psychrobacter sp. DAB_AL32B TaxID=1028414 RepID=UPI000B800E15|nr:hypothetical protein [Psychrobacter sp. DAB_AL32B]OXL19165.1 hypothetical protein CAN34_11610 [Psychrobacter sp. DAB_AL32B]
MTNTTDSSTQAPVSDSNQQVAEFSLRLIYPFSFTGDIDDFNEKHLSQQTIGNLLNDQLPLFLEAFGLESSQNNNNDTTVDLEILETDSIETKKQKRKAAKGQKLAILKANPLWQKCYPAISKDLYPHIRHLLRTEHTELSQCYELTDESWQLLDAGIGRFGKGLSIDLSPTSTSRLGLSADEGKHIPFSFCRTMNGQQNQKPQLYLFGFGEGLLTVELSIDTKFLKKYQTCAVLEFIHAITHINAHSSNISFLIKKDSGSLQQTHHKTNLLNIFYHLLGQNSSEQDSQQANTNNYSQIPYSEHLSRFFSYAALRFDSTYSMSISTINEAKREKISALAYSMAHRHTDHYLPTSESVNTGVYLPFVNIAHCNSIEGGAIVIDTMYVKDATNEVSIIEHNQLYIKNTIRNAYWPMILLSYLEFIYLIKLTSDTCNDVSLLSVDEDTIKNLEDLRRKMLSFRLHFRYSQASQLAQHNKFYSRWRHAFGSDILADELADDILQINNLLTYKLDKDEKALQEQQNKHFTILGILATTLLTTIGIFETNFKLYSDPELKILSPLTFMTFGVALILAVIACFVYLKIFEKRQ